MRRVKADAQEGEDRHNPVDEQPHQRGRPVRFEDCADDVADGQHEDNSAPCEAQAPVHPQEPGAVPDHGGTAARANCAVNGIDVAVTRMNKPRSSDATPRPYMMRKASTAAPPRKPSTRMTSRIIACTTGRILTPPRAVTAVTVIADQPDDSRPTDRNPVAQHGEQHERDEPDDELDGIHVVPRNIALPEPRRPPRKVTPPVGADRGRASCRASTEEHRTQVENWPAT